MSDIYHERDPFSPIKYSYDGVTTIFREHGEKQDIEVIESQYFGKMLLLDGVVQVTEKDEFFYHEMLVHVAMHSHGSATRVLIIGGGDGGSLREVLKYPGVEDVVLVEHDEKVVEVSKLYFPGLSLGFSDVRTSIVFHDGVDYLKSITGGLDLVIVDSTDPVGGAEGLYSEEFFLLVYNALRDNGMLVIQSESLHFHREFVIQVQKRLGSVFKYADLHTQSLSTYAGNWWTFSIGSKSLDPRMVRQMNHIDTRYYHRDIHSWLFLPTRVYSGIMDGSLQW